jgi:hypothetical protein
MENIEILLELFGGSVLLAGFGYLVGHLLKLDKYWDDQINSQQLHLRKTDTPINEPGDLMQDNEF